MRRGGGSEIGSGFESLLCGFEIVAAPIEVGECRVGERQLWVELESGLEFALGTRLIFLRYGQHAQGQMISGTVLIFVAQTLDELAPLIEIAQCPPQCWRSA